LTQGPDNSSDKSPHDHAAETHRPGPSSESGDTEYNWRIHHPFEGIEDRVAVEVAPWQGLLPRWRFVVPGEFNGVARWGIGPPGTGNIDENVKRPAKGGPTQMVNGPLVVWFGGHESLSTKQSAYLVFEGEPPHYVAFGQAEDDGGPPGTLEGISFGDNHPAHPGESTLDPAHGHEHAAPEAEHGHEGHGHPGHDHEGHHHQE